MEIAYEPHPVSAERKGELRAQGYKIIDASYAPEKAEAQPERVKRAYRKRGGDDGADS
jgi:hypothetical protein